MTRRTRGREIALQVLYMLEQNPQVEADYIRPYDGEVHFNAAPCQPKDGWPLVLAAKHLLWICSGLDSSFALGAAQPLSELEQRIDQYSPATA